MTINQDAVVTMAYQLYVVEGEDQLALIEDRSPQNPLDFIFGTGQLLPAVEKAIQGQTPGFNKVLRLEAEQAFGHVVPELITQIPQGKFPKKLELKIGMKFQTQGPKGDVIAVMVKEIKDGQVLLDGNHPLAGAAVQFDLRVMRVRPATKEELATGVVKDLYH